MLSEYIKIGAYVTWTIYKKDAVKKQFHMGSGVNPVFGQ